MWSHYHDKNSGKPWSSERTTQDERIKSIQFQSTAPLNKQKMLTMCTLKGNLSGFIMEILWVSHDALNEGLWQEFNELLSNIFQAWGFQLLPLWNRGCSESMIRTKRNCHSSSVFTFIVYNPSHSTSRQKNPSQLQNSLIFLLLQMTTCSQYFIFAVSTASWKRWNQFHISFCRLHDLFVSADFLPQIPPFAHSVSAYLA